MMSIILPTFKSMFDVNKSAKVSLNSLQIMLKHTLFCICRSALGNKIVLLLPRA